MIKTTVIFLLFFISFLLLSSCKMKQPNYYTPDKMMRKVRDEHKEALERMLSEIERDMSRSAHITGVCKLSWQVRLAFSKVPRHLFAPREEEELAYLNRALSIGEGQTISQPFIVALMTELLHLKPWDKVLEIGTGSGYQAAIFAELGAEVYTVEIIEPLAAQAQRRLTPKARLPYRPPLERGPP